MTPRPRKQRGDLVVIASFDTGEGEYWIVEDEDQLQADDRFSVRYSTEDSPTETVAENVTLYEAVRETARRFHKALESQEAAVEELRNSVDQSTFDGDASMAEYVRRQRSAYVAATKPARDVPPPWPTRTA